MSSETIQWSDLPAAGGEAAERRAKGRHGCKPELCYASVSHRARVAIEVVHTDAITLSMLSGRLSGLECIHGVVGGTQTSVIESHGHVVLT